MRYLVAFAKIKVSVWSFIKKNSSPEFQTQVQKGLLALDQAAYISLTGVPSKEQLQSEEVPERKTKQKHTTNNTQNRFIKLILEALLLRCKHNRK